MEFEIDVGEEYGFEMELGDEYGLEFAWQATNTVVTTPMFVTLTHETVYAHALTGVIGHEEEVTE